MIQPPANSGSYFYNYKGQFSIVLLALVDANYKFLMIDVGCNGRISDGGVFKNSSFGKAFNAGRLELPPPIPLPGREKLVPFVIVADDAFPLKENLMKPYSRCSLNISTRIFNYRLSRARRIVENAFGILANRFRLFMTPIALDLGKVERIVIAACCLHNFLQQECPDYASVGSMDTEDSHGHTEFLMEIGAMTPNRKDGVEL